MSRNETAYEQGREAAERGHERHSPYEGIKAEEHWYFGYDEEIINGYYRKLSAITKKYQEMEFSGGVQERYDRMLEEIQNMAVASGFGKVADNEK